MYAGTHVATITIAICYCRRRCWQAPAALLAATATIAVGPHSALARAAAAAVAAATPAAAAAAALHEPARPLMDATEPGVSRLGSVGSPAPRLPGSLAPWLPGSLAGRMA